MSEKVFLQLKNNKPYSFAAAVQLEGFQQLGYEVVPFNVIDIDTTPWSRDYPVIGGVGTIKRALDILGIDFIHDTYPDELKHYLKRKVGETKLGLLTHEDLPLFIKPKNDDKKFTGFVCKDLFDKRLSGCLSDLDIYTSEVVDIITEYRCYILNGKIMNIARYTGFVEYQPNIDLIRGMIMSYHNAPIAYSLDVGVTREKETVLIEINGALSLGNYGLSPVIAAKMSAARWYQLTGRDYSVESSCHDSPSFVSQC